MVGMEAEPEKNPFKIPGMAKALSDKAVAAKRQKKLEAFEPDPGVVDREPGMPDRLYDMRHVVARPQRTDWTNSQRAFREWLGTSPASFMQQMEKMEDQWSAKKAPTQGDTDEGTDAALELLKNELSRRPWACPTCKGGT